MPDGDDWDRVVYAPLAALDPKLATRLHARFVARFATRARLSDREREDAAEQLALDRGVAPDGTLVLRAGLPLGCGESFHGWDGSPAGAEEIVDSMAETAGADLFDDLVGDGFDTLTLSVEHGGTTWPDQVVFTINGRDLRRLARATGLVDAGMTGPPRSVLAEHPDHLLGGPDRWAMTDEPFYDDPALLGCGCGAPGVRSPARPHRGRRPRRGVVRLPSGPRPRTAGHRAVPLPPPAVPGPAGPAARAPVSRPAVASGARAGLGR
jgi:hypothetical protein